MTDRHVSNFNQVVLHVEKKYDHCQTVVETLVLFVTFVGINKYLSPIEYGPL